MRTVILSDALVPGTPAGVEFSDFENLVLNNEGQTAFFGYLTGAGVGVGKRTGIWSEGVAMD